MVLGEAKMGFNLNVISHAPCSLAGTVRGRRPRNRTAVSSGTKMALEGNIVDKLLYFKCVRCIATFEY
jgi:hypothetical protein